MRLLRWNDDFQFSLTPDIQDDELPPYAILSHTWGSPEDEVTFADMQNGEAQSKVGYKKIQFCGEQAKKDDIKHFWVDTCCIDKANNTELTEAITSMYRWYQNSQKCYVYLSDISNGHAELINESRSVLHEEFCKSRWFKRGWTLQELIAPSIVEFYSKDCEYLGTKGTLGIQISEITTIPLAVLQGSHPCQFPIDERIRWTEARQTKRKEDQAYCLLGIFDICMPLVYGEGDNALRRLRQEINQRFGEKVAASLGEDRTARSLGLCLKSAPTISAEDFVGRSVEIDAIHNILQPGAALREQRRAVLGGMGGIGKTQLAIAYARQYQEIYSSTLWLNATSTATIFASVREACQPLISSEDLSKLDDEQALARLQEWLCHPSNSGWLLIFDNYDEPESFDIHDFYPNVSHGFIIITTRLPDQVAGTQVRVRQLEEVEDALEILQKRSGRKDVRHDSDARRLAKRLDGLPLALATTGAFLRKSTLTFGQYLEVYLQRFNANPRRPTQLQEYRDRTLYTTWNLTVSRLEKEDGLAANMLKLLAYFDNQKVWYGLLRAGLADEVALEWVQEVMTSPIEFDNTMQILVEYCLLEIHPETESYSLHNCVHDWTAAELNNTSRQEYYQYALMCVANSIDAIEPIELQLPHHDPLARHASHLAGNRLTLTTEPDLTPLIVYQGLYSLAKLLLWHGQSSEARDLFLRILAAYETILGPNDNKTLWVVDRLGRYYMSEARYSDAERMFDRVLKHYEPTSKLDQTLRLRAIAQQGNVYRRQERFAAAEKMIRVQRSESERVYGFSHENTFEAIHSYACILAELGRFVEAEQMFKQARTGIERLRGSEHPGTLSMLKASYRLFLKAGEFQRAKPLLHRTLSAQETTFGPMHVRTLETVYDLARMYARQGRFDEAEECYQRVLDGYEPMSNPTNTNGLRVMADMLLIYRKQRRLGEAERMGVRALTILHKGGAINEFLYSDVCENLGFIYEIQNRFDQAKHMYIQALPGLEAEFEKYGLADPSVPQCLVSLYSFLGMSEKARQVQERIQTLQQQSTSGDNEERSKNSQVRGPQWENRDDTQSLGQDLTPAVLLKSDDTVLLSDLSNIKDLQQSTLNDSDTAFTRTATPKPSKLPRLRSKVNRLALNSKNQ